MTPSDSAAHARFTHALRVRWGECDPQGVVFNANYVAWVDAAHWEMWRALVGSFDHLRELGVLFVVAESRQWYRQGARFDDQIEIDVDLVALSESSKTSRYRIRRGEGLLVEATVRHVCVDASTLTKAAWPDAVRAALEPYLDAEGEH